MENPVSETSLCYHIVMNPDYFEALMLVCFGLAWPFSIYRMLKTKKSSGKSIPFVAIILLGYVSGTCYQWFGERDFVIYLYILNTAMVVMDIALTVKYRRQ